MLNIFFNLGKIRNKIITQQNKTNHKLPLAIHCAERCWCHALMMLWSCSEVRKGSMLLGWRLDNRAAFSFAFVVPVGWWLKIQHLEYHFSVPPYLCISKLEVHQIYSGNLPRAERVAYLYNYSRKLRTCSLQGASGLG